MIIQRFLRPILVNKSLLAQVGGAGVLAGTSDALCQYVVEKNDKIDFARVARFSGLVSCCIAPLAYKWYRYIERIIPSGSSLKWSFKRMAANQIVAAPFFTSLCLFNLNFLETRNLKTSIHVPYVLIGGGTASYYAAITIRAYDPDSKVLMIAAENEAPYNRPPLSKELWLYGTENVDKTFEYIGVTGKKRDIRYESDGFYLNPRALDKFEHGGVSLLRNTFVTEIDPENKEVTLNSGKKVKYDKLLIATGGKPKIPYPFYSPHLRNKVMTYHNSSDFQKLHHIAKDSSSILIYGNGPAASELAYSIQTKFGKDRLKIIQVFPEQFPMQESLPPNVGKFVRNAIVDAGVTLESQTKACSVDKLPNGRVEVVLEKDGEKSKIIVDHIVVAVGNEACTKLAEKAGIRVDPTWGAIIADSKLQTSHSDIYAAGDVVAYEDPFTGRMRSEHWENAQITGRLAGQNMAGHVKDFHHHASYSSMFGHNLHLYAVGQTDSTLKTVSIFAPHDKEDPDELVRGVVFYLKKDKIVGILLCNIFGVGLEIGRRIIKDAHEVKDFVELAKLFDIYLPKSDQAIGDMEEEESKAVADPESTPIIV